MFIQGRIPEQDFRAGFQSRISEQDSRAGLWNPALLPQREGDFLFWGEMKVCWSRTGSGTRETSLLPARFSCGRGNRRGVPCPRKGYSPPKERSKHGRGRGVGREKQAYSPPGSAANGKTDGEWGVHGMGTPRRRNKASWLRGKACWSRTGSGMRKRS